MKTLIEEAPDGLRFRARRLEIITGIAQQAALEVAHSWQLAYEDCRTVAEIAISRLGKCREQLDECREPH